MRRFFSICAMALLFGCAQYPDITGLAPQAALTALNDYEELLDEGEQNLRTPDDTFVPAGGLIAAGEALDPLMTQISLDNIAADRARMKADRERIYRANPSLRPKPTQVSSNAGRALSTPNTSTCRFPASAVTDAKRRVLYNEASKGNFPAAFQTQQQLMAEFNATGGGTCRQITQQIDATMNSHRAAVLASDKFINGTPLGLQCNPNGSASRSAACSAVTTLYTAHSVAAICNQVCN